jgi:peptidoglycan/LPS O-acetylase OafA/YrhL
MINQLTGIRAILAWWVVLLHILCNEEMSRYFRLSTLFSHGDLAVHGFFVLSGFILCHVYAGKLLTGSAARYGSFLVARIARIYPVHFVVLIAFIPAVFANRWLHLPNSSTGFSVVDLGLSLILVQAWGFILHPAWNGVAWSISAEWFAYLLFPAFLLLIVKKPSVIRSVAATIASIVGLYWVSVTQASTPGPAGLYRTALVMVCANFALGCVAFVATKAVRKARPWVGAAAGGAAIICATLKFNAFFSLLFAVVVAALSSDQDWLSGALSNKIMVYLGETSYSVYMIHLFLWEAVAATARKAGVLHGSGAPFVVVVALIVIALASFVSYHVIEVPARAYIRELGSSSPRLRAAG